MADEATPGYLARHPWLAFVLIGCVPPALLFGNVLAATLSLAALFPALAAALIASEEGAPVVVPGDRVRRLLLGAGVFLVPAEVRLAQTGLDAVAYVALVGVVPAVLAAWVLSGAYSPGPALRTLIRRLVRRGATRGAYLVALLAWPAAAIIAGVVCSRVSGVSVSPPRASSAGFLAGWVISGVVGSALAAVAWYGFAARRLLPRLGPLASGLVVGVAPWLLTWGLSLGPGSLTDAFFLSGLIGAAASGVAGVWILMRSRGSLLPVWLMGSLVVATGGVAFLVVVPETAERSDTFDAVFAATRAVVGLGLVVAGRMWRRGPA